MGTIALLPFDPAHVALLHLQTAQQGEARRFRVPGGAAADLGPAYTVAEMDDAGAIVSVLGCGGLIENAPDYATAWAMFAEGLRSAQWAALAAMIRGALEASSYARIDMIARADFPAAHRFARHLGFETDAIVFARPGGGAMFHEEPFHEEAA